MTTHDEVRIAVSGQVNSLAGRPAADPIGPDEHLIEQAGLDSVTFLATLVWVEDHYRVTIPDEDLAADELTTIAGISGYVSARLAGR
jgi:acyl carrier protein